MSAYQDICSKISQFQYNEEDYRTAAYVQLLTFVELFDFIKLFPAGTLGLKYCKDIYAPLHYVKYIATVGVTEETFRQYLEIGFAGAGISSMLVDKKLRAEGNYAELTERARRFTAIAEAFS